MAPSTKLHGRAFYESIGSPKYIVAPMVDQSEFAWRLLTRSFLPPDLRTSILAYSPMFHAKLFADSPKYRKQHFEATKSSQLETQPKSGAKEQAQGENADADEAYLDGNPKVDRPLFVQFCANDPDALLEAAKTVQAHCDAVDLNLGCPQGIARRGHYGAFLQEDWDTIYKLINNLHTNLDIPVTAKMRILETKERTLEYAQMILSAGASIITVHGRQRDQKGHNTGLADWTVIRYLREQLPPDTVMFANGNILQYDDLQRCLDATGADGIMSAEGNLFDPSIFSPGPPVGEEGREYWRGRDGKGGYRVDAVFRRYLDIIHTHVLGRDPPARRPLALASDPAEPEVSPAEPASEPTASTNDNHKRQHSADEEGAPDSAPPAKKSKTLPPNGNGTNGNKKSGKHEKCTNPNLSAMQAHSFHLLRSLVTTHHDVRDALARSRAGDIDAYEHVLALTEAAVAQGLREYARDPAQFEDSPEDDDGDDPSTSSASAIRRCRRPFWVCQSRVRPLPAEAVAKGSLQLSKKEKARREREREQEAAREVGVAEHGKVEVQAVPVSAGEMGGANGDANGGVERVEVEELPKEGLTCG